MQKGSVLVVFALMLVILLGITALVIDVGYRRLVADQLQNGADAAALAGVASFVDGPATVRSRAVVLAGANVADGAAIEVPEADVVIGTWDRGSRTFTALSGADEEDGNAVHVVTRVATPKRFISAVLGVANTPVVQEAIAFAAGEAAPGCGLFSNIKMSISGNPVVDAYDSEAGPYAGANSGLPGGICSNDDIEISGSDTHIEGDATCGPGKRVLLSSGTVTGSTDCLDTRVPVEPVAFGSIATSNDNGTIPKTTQGKTALSSSRDLSISSGDSLTLQAGDYYFKTLNVSGTLRTVGDVNLYVQEQVSVSGPGIVNSDGEPTTLTILTNSSSGVNLSGSANFYGSVQAPYADISISGYANYYGVFFGGKVTLSGDVLIHMDTALMRPGAVEATTRPALVQ